MLQRTDKANFALINTEQEYIFLRNHCWIYQYKIIVISIKFLHFVQSFMNLTDLEYFIFKVRELQKTLRNFSGALDTVATFLVKKFYRLGLMRFYIF